MTILVTGAAGFIGSNFVLDWCAQNQETVLNIDKLTYAGNLENLASLQNNAQHIFVQADIANGDLMLELLTKHQPRAIINFAAESHVDRSISSAMPFAHTNFLGLTNLLEGFRDFCKGRFIQISTDEVYGSISQGSWSEDRPLSPNSPYSASKAGAADI